MVNGIVPACCCGVTSMARFMSLDIHQIDAFIFMANLSAYNCNSIIALRMAKVNFICNGFPRVIENSCVS